MATPKKFAMQQVLNLLLRRPADKSIIGYLDNLKTSGLENTVEMTFPTGGRGNVYIGVGFAHSKRATLNIECATWNTDVMAAQNGTEVVRGATSVVEYDVLTYNSVEGYKTKFIATGVAGDELSFAYVLNADGTQGAVYTQGTETSAGVFTYDNTTGILTFDADDMEALTATNAKLCCAYNRQTTGDAAQKISLKGTTIPAVVLVTGYGIVVDICSNVAYLCQFNGKAQVDGNYTFDLSADGDPAVQSLNLEFVRDCGLEDLYSFVIYEDAPPPPQAVIKTINGKAALNDGFSVVINNLTSNIDFQEGQIYEVKISVVGEETETLLVPVTTKTIDGQNYTGLFLSSDYEYIVSNATISRNPDTNTGVVSLTPNSGSLASSLPFTNGEEIIDTTIVITFKQYNSRTLLTLTPDDFEDITVPSTTTHILIDNQDSILGLKTNTNYSLTITYEGKKYTAITQSEKNEVESGVFVITAEFQLFNLPEAVQPVGSSFGVSDGAKYNTTDLSPVYGDYYTVGVQYDDNEGAEAFKNGISQLLLTEITF